MGEMRYMISDASKLVEVQPNVLRYFEEHLSLDINRNEMGHRYYSEKDIELFKSVKNLKEQGFPLKAIKMILPNIDKIKKMEPERLDDFKDKLAVAVGLFGMEAKQSLKDKYNNGNSRTSINKAQEIGQTNEQIVNQWETSQMREAQKEIQESKEIQETKETGETKEMGETKEVQEIQEMKETGETRKTQEIKASMVAGSITLQETDALVERGDDDKIIQFKKIMCDIMKDAMQENSEQLTKNISENVSKKVIKELDYLMRLREERKEEREEERYKQLDRTIREHQLSRQQAAVTREFGSKKKESKFFKKNSKVRI